MEIQNDFPGVRPNHNLYNSIPLCKPTVPFIYPTSVF